MIKTNTIMFDERMPQSWQHSKRAAAECDLFIVSFYAFSIFVIKQTFTYLNKILNVVISMNMNFLLFNIKAVGTSLKVSPACELPDMAMENGARVLL